ncbi:MAG: DUF4870 domain-containing protein [Chthoniobacterales bacterium]
MDNTPPLVPDPPDQTPAPTSVPPAVPPNVPAFNPTPDNSLAVVMHLLGFAGFVFPLGNLLAPLILWLVKRVESPELDRVGKEVLNFQISYSIYIMVAGGLCFFCVGFVVLPVVLVAWIVFMIIAAVKTSNGESYSYPLSLRLIQ